jgi:hypothetical protein
MQINFKSYKIKKNKHYIKKNNIYFFFKAPSRSAKNWILIDQTLKIMNFTYYKIFNKASRNIINKSIYKNINEAINGITFLIKPKSLKITKEILIANLESLCFNMLAVKLNNKIYQTMVVKNSFSLYYPNVKKIAFQFRLIHLKKSK